MCDRSQLKQQELALLEEHRLLEEEFERLTAENSELSDQLRDQMAALTAMMRMLRKAMHEQPRRGTSLRN